MGHLVDSFPGRELSINGEQFLYFGGTAYLGLQTDKDFQELYIKNVKRYGTNYGASRKGNIGISVYEKVERFLAKLIGAENSLTVSSGYLAGQLILYYFAKQGFSIFYAPGTHEAVHSKQSKNHETLDALIDDLRKATDRQGNKTVLFLDSIDLKGSNYPNFGWLEELPTDKLILVVDDSHALGIIGDDGGGVFRKLQRFRFNELVICGSLGKGFGIQGGVIAGTKRLIEDLRHTKMFAAASPAAPSSLTTLLEATEILSKQRKSLIGNIEYFLTRFDHPNFFDHLPQYPCFAFNDSSLCDYLEERKVLITNFSYPTENDPKVQRLVLSAAHFREDIDKLTSHINAYRSK